MVGADPRGSQWASGDSQGICHPHIATQKEAFDASVAFVWAQRLRGAMRYFISPRIGRSAGGQAAG